MSIKVIKPTGNARRQMSVSVFKSENKRPEKSLTFGSKRSGGRNSHGHKTATNLSGGMKRLFRLVDFSQLGRIGQKGKVVGLEYDPFRTAIIALIEYENGEKSYVIAPKGLKKNASIVCDEITKAVVGNRMQLKNIPASSQIYNIELFPKKGGELARSAGNYAILMGLDKDMAILKLASGEIRKVKSDCFASLGVVSNEDHSKEKIGKAGRVRLSGRKPHVRGKAKNPCDHPHGGGEGGTSIGLKHPKTPWGMPALGHKTRKKSKKSGRLIIKRKNV